MIAGAFGFDYVMLVISANEGNKTSNNRTYRNYKPSWTKRDYCSNYKKDLVTQDELELKKRNYRVFKCL